MKLSQCATPPSLSRLPCPDGGATWQSVYFNPSLLSIFSVSAPNSSTVWALGSNFGATSSEQLVGPASAHNCCAAQRSRALLGTTTSASLPRTSRPCACPLVTARTPACSFHCTGSSSLTLCHILLLRVVSGAAAADVVLRSLNGGATWENVTCGPCAGLPPKSIEARRCAPMLPLLVLYYGR